ncbi:hypothetical protein ACJX0J_039442, partial [Zea mays]
KEENLYSRLALRPECMLTHAITQHTCLVWLAIFVLFLMEHLAITAGYVFNIK